jgi:hypothetical protein
MVCSDGCWHNFCGRDEPRCPLACGNPFSTTIIKGGATVSVSLLDVADKVAAALAAKDQAVPNFGLKRKPCACGAPPSSAPPALSARGSANPRNPAMEPSLSMSLSMNRYVG